jgi:diguanylate cyclase (GGDEF)-like protein
MNLAAVATAAGVAFALGRLSSRPEAVAARREASTDSLTGLTNRAGLMRQLQDRADRGHPYTVFLLDLNGFKPVNDTYGHGIGDELLVRLAARLHGETGGGLAARLGGDEFVVVLDGIFPGEVALSFATRLCRTVRRPMVLPGIVEPVVLGAAVGITAGRPGEHPRVTLHAADQAMYRSKALGIPHLQTARDSTEVPERPPVRLRDTRRVRVA